MSAEKIQEALLDAALCSEGVTRKGEFQPCETTAVALRLDPREDGAPYAVCAYHARAPMVPLYELIGALVDAVA